MNIRITDDFELRPKDNNNWELYQRRAVKDSVKARMSGTVGEVKWRSCGRFYQCGSIHLAVLYVADEIMKDRPGEAVSLREAVEEHEGVVRELVERVVKCLR